MAYVRLLKARLAAPNNAERRSQRGRPALQGLRIVDLYSRKGIDPSRLYIKARPSPRACAPCVFSARAPLECARSVCVHAAWPPCGWRRQRNSTLASFSPPRSSAAA